MIKSRKHFVASVPEIASVLVIPDVAVNVKLSNLLLEDKYSNQSHVTHIPRDEVQGGLTSVLGFTVVKLTFG